MKRSKCSVIFLAVNLQSLPVQVMSVACGKATCRQMKSCLLAMGNRTRILYARECGAEAMELEAEHQEAAALPGLWHDLQELAEQVDAGLHTTKAAFAKQTREQVLQLAEHKPLCLP